MARCQYLLNEYVGQYNASICKCTDDKKCQKKAFKRIPSRMCYDCIVQQRHPTAIITSGDGSPTRMVTPLETLEQFPESP